eukprot:TRINITY_DN6622_c0_g1_i1.p1 TRINITY_DN6622_c0_g1~~TRINITY_DN6622_c0_g1_i1.p1  ORF type:complete len:170 (-),score=40.63 TRINITY_DN6622_c0_g1_i1:59-568(-)
MSYLLALCLALSITILNLISSSWACTGITTCNECILSSNCVWCSTSSPETSFCNVGGVLGPYGSESLLESCSIWTWGQCVVPGMSLLIMIAITIGVISIGILIGIVFCCCAIIKRKERRIEEPFFVDNETLYSNDPHYQQARDEMFSKYGYFSSSKKKKSASAVGSAKK